MRTLEMRVRLKRLIQSAGIRGAPQDAGAERLDIVLPRGWPQSGAAWHWRWSRRGSTPQAGQAQTLKELPPQAASASIQVWTPAAETLLTQTRLPTQSRQRIVQALPYALEDQLLGDPESLHFAYRREADGALSVAITARERLQVWREALTQAGLNPASLCPVTLAVPWAADGWSAVFWEDEILVRRGAAAGFVCPFSENTPPAMLALALAEAAKAKQSPEFLVVFQPPRGFRPETWAEALKIPVRVENASLLDRQPDLRAPLDLLQGELAPSGQLRASLRPYRPAAALLLVWLLGNVVFDLYDWLRLRSQHQRYQREMTAILIEAFPDTKVVRDPAAQMKSNLERLQRHRGAGSQDLLPVLARVTPALAADTRVRVRGLRYAERTLTLDLTVPASGTLETLKQALRGAGLQAEILSATARGREVDGRLRVQASGAKS
jgi:general secretion pathway protein L